MDEKITRLLDIYRPLGIVKAGELLLRPEDALRLADDLERIGVGIAGVDVWYYVGENIAEGLEGTDLSSLLKEEDSVKKSIAYAKQFIREHLSQRTVFVSFITKPAIFLRE